MIAGPRQRLKMRVEFRPNVLNDWRRGTRKGNWRSPYNSAARALGVCAQVSRKKSRDRFHVVIQQDEEFTRGHANPSIACSRPPAIWLPDGMKLIGRSEERRVGKE